MSEQDFAHLAAQHVLGDQPVPAIVLELAAGREPRLVWRNDLGGLTFDLGDRYLKWNPRRTGIDLDRERIRLEWISRRHPAPAVIAAGADREAQWLVTKALPGESAVGDGWRRRRHQAIAAIAAGSARHPRRAGRRRPRILHRRVLGRPAAAGARPAPAGRAAGAGARRRLRTEHADRGRRILDRPCRLRRSRRRRPLGRSRDRVAQPRLELRRGASARAVRRLRDRARPAPDRATTASCGS